jgi:hypothetical protein
MRKAACGELHSAWAEVKAVEPCRVLAQPPTAVRQPVGSKVKLSCSLKKSLMKLWERFVTANKSVGPTSKIVVAPLKKQRYAPLQNSGMQAQAQTIPAIQ